MKKVLVLDFGGQYNLLVARRVRECGVYCEIKSYRLSMADIRAFGPDALILTGGPATVFEPNAPMVDRALFEMGIPVLGICYGQQLMMQLLGGQCRKAETREDSRTRRQTCSTGVSDNNSPELVVVTRWSGSRFSRCHATESMMGCRRVSGSSTSSSGLASRSRRTVPLACRSVENRPSKITRWVRPPGRSIIRLMMSR